MGRECGIFIITRVYTWRLVADAVLTQADHVLPVRRVHVESQPKTPILYLHNSRVVKAKVYVHVPVPRPVDYGVM